MSGNSATKGKAMQPHNKHPYYSALMGQERWTLPSFRRPDYTNQPMQVLQPQAYVHPRRQLVLQRRVEVYCSGVRRCTAAAAQMHRSRRFPGMHVGRAGSSSSRHAPHGHHC
jgi:hypothetical protein